MMVSNANELSGMGTPLRQNFMRPITTRLGFTLMEMLAVILLITTIIGFGVPALYSFEKKKAAKDGMNQFNDLLRSVTRFSVLTATRGYTIQATDGQVVSVYRFPTDIPTYTALDGKSYSYSKRLFAKVTISGILGRQIEMKKLFKEQFGSNDPSMFKCDSSISDPSVPDDWTKDCTYYRLIDSDQTLCLIDVDNVGTAKIPFDLSFDPISGMIKDAWVIDDTKPAKFTFRGQLIAGTNAYRINETLSLFRMGYSDVK